MSAGSGCDKSTYDLRALAPSQVTDPNGNLTLAAYDALGRVTALALQSKAVDSHGTPLTVEGDTLADPTQSFEYHPEASPPYTFARARETHGDPGTRWIETTAYSDGTGHVVQAKVTAAPDEATPTTPRWIGTGRVVLNNKGLPIKQYEPFFADTAEFEAEAGFAGVTPILTYDPLGRPIQVDLPNKTVRRVAFDPWRQVTWDENDLVAEAVVNGADTDLTDAVPTSHADTPTTVSLDAQGRVYKTEEYTDAALPQLVTRLTLDAVGNPTVVTDARGIAVRTQTFDMVGRPIVEESSDGGDTTAILDAAGQPRFLFKSGDLGIETESDALRRTVRTWEWNTATGDKWLRERLVYGEALKDGTTYEPADDDLRGRMVRQYDEAGLLTPTYDWRGNVRSTTRLVLDDDEAKGDWTTADPVAYPYVASTPDTESDVAALDIAAGATMTGTAHVVASTWDALNRVVTKTAPNGAVTTHTYDDGGAFFRVDVDGTTLVSATRYNARGQRIQVRYGPSGAVAFTSVQTYEAETFRLATLTTTRASDSALLQALTYAYDPVGNIVSIADGAQKTLYVSNSAVSSEQAFEYDAAYRLISATGREKLTRGTVDWADPEYGPVPASSQVGQRYAQDYTYDEAGNLTQLAHSVPANTGLNWTRDHTIATGSNRLESTRDTAGTVDHQSDDRGNTVFLPHLYNDGATPNPTPNVTVDFRDQMVRAQLNGADYAVYHYGADGQRVRKVVKKGANVEDRVYVDGYEVWRKSTSGILQEERTTVQVVDDQSRIAMIETKRVDGGSVVASPTPRIRIQLGNQLGTATVEVTETGQIISYEEYHPYGSTAWWAGSSATVSQKRYRYTGMERDEETGLQCHGVRYYAPWLGRWASADPIGLGDGSNRFSYCHGRPTSSSDPSGLAAPEEPLMPPECIPDVYVDDPDGSLLMGYDRQSFDEEVGESEIHPTDSRLLPTRVAPQSTVRGAPSERSKKLQQFLRTGVPATVNDFQVPDLFLDMMRFADNVTRYTLGEPAFAYGLASDGTEIVTAAPNTETGSTPYVPLALGDNRRAGATESIAGHGHPLFSLQGGERVKAGRAHPSGIPGDVQTLIEGLPAAKGYMIYGPAAERFGDSDDHGPGLMLLLPTEGQAQRRLELGAFNPETFVGQDPSDKLNQLSEVAELAGYTLFMVDLHTGKAGARRY